MTLILNLVRSSTMPRTPVGLSLAILLSTACAPAAPPSSAVPPPAPPSATTSTGILVMAHGGDPTWNARVDDALTDLRRRVPVALALGMADRRTLQAGVDSLSARGVTRVAVVRMFLSGRSFEAQTRYLLGLDPTPPEVFLHHGPAAGHGAHAPGAGSPPPAISAPGVELATHPDGLMDWRGVGPILVERAHAAGAVPDGPGVLVLAHGMGDERENRAVLDRMDAAAHALRDAGYGPVRVETLREDWPAARAAAEVRIREWVAEVSTDGEGPVVVPFRLAGFGPYAEVLDGLTYRPAEALLPHPSVADWVEEAARRVACERRWTAPTGRCSD